MTSLFCFLEENKFVAFTYHRSQTRGARGFPTLVFPEAVSDDSRGTRVYSLFHRP